MRLPARIQAYYIHRKKVYELLKYTLPLVLVGFGGVVIANTDRFMLKSFVSLSAVGIYALALRFKSVLTFLIINPFTRGYGPFRFSIMKQSNAKEIYSRVTTHFCLLLCWMWLILATLSEEVIAMMAKETYHDACLLKICGCNCGSWCFRIPRSGCCYF